MLNRRVAVACAALLLAAAAPAKHAAHPKAAAAPTQTVVLQPQPGSKLDATVRALLADDLAAAKARGDRPLVLIGQAPLGGPQPALFVQLQSPQECGSAGCATSVYSFEGGGWRQVLDGVTGHITVAAKRTKGRADLLADKDHFVWTGRVYRSTHPAPALDLRPHPRKR